jgi:hypothetical protein
MAATGTFTFYEKGLGKLVGGSIDLDATDIRVLLTTSAYVPNVATHEFVASITNELAGNGYARQALVAEAKTHVGSGVWMFDSNNPEWVASGGTLVARYFVLYDYNVDDAAAALIGYGLLDNTDEDVTAADADTIRINVHAEGWFRWTSIG